MHIATIENRRSTNKKISNFRSQSAMEYLMTYGWAILIISIVLSALWSMGIFSSSSNLGRAPPGSCRVYRPSSSVSNTYIRLVGVCTGQPPQYVAQFNGQSSYIMTGTSPNLNFYGATNAITVSAWIYPTNDAYDSSNQWYIVSDLNYPNSGWWFLLENGGQVQFDNCNSGNCAFPEPVSANPVPLNQWSQVVAVGNGLVGQIYINGVLAGTGTLVQPLDANSNVYIDITWSGGMFQGNMADVQLYNTSFSAAQVSSLYAEGIGGTPTVLTNLVGWWPLNGNPNDYSGNNNNGAATSVSFMSSWTR
jgi:hypothetical protein